MQKHRAAMLDCHAPSGKKNVSSLCILAIDRAIDWLIDAQITICDLLQFYLVGGYNSVLKTVVKSNKIYYF